MSGDMFLRWEYDKKHRDWKYLVDFKGSDEETYTFAIIQVEPSLGLKAYIPLKGHKFFEHSQLVEAKEWVESRVDKQAIFDYMMENIYGVERES
jgi:hypothetical protein